MAMHISTNFTNYELDDPNKGRQEYFKLVMEAMSELPLFALVIGTDMEKATGKDGVGGFMRRFRNIDSLNLSNKVKVNGNKIKFESEFEFAIFVHESSHLLHFHRDNGVCVSPYYCGQKCILETDDNAEVRKAEYEAGYRAILMDKHYKMFPGKKLVRDMNLINLFFYDINQPNHAELKKKLGDMGNINANNDNPESGWLYTHMCNNVKRYADWADPKHDIEINF